MPTSNMPLDFQTQAECYSAIRGENVPEDLTNVAVRVSLIRGIRLHHAFAASDDVDRICAHDPQLTRARNASLIMSGQVPDSVMPRDEQPYCIWHPHLADEQTYRVLARRHPQMRYQVGRACAAAGYHDLYRELDLLPDIAIAEEARESETEGGRLIYDAIMRSPHRYSVMDDASLNIRLDDPPSPAFLNGDTEVRWKLRLRAVTPSAFVEDRQAGIEEDMGINDEYVPYEQRRRYLEPDQLKLLYQPLPPDLPTVKKSLLTCMAAFEGNIDRYARLAPPRSREGDIGRDEMLCVIRGIYHHTMFARWWVDKIARLAPSSTKPIRLIKMAISARRIMINDPRDFCEHGWPADTPMPYLIWWPLRPGRDILYMLADKVPDMREQVAIAAICCDFDDVYRQLSPEPSWRLWLAAGNSHNPFYRQDLERRAAGLGREIESGSMQDPDAPCLASDLEPTQFFDFFEPRVVWDGVTDREGPYYQGFGPDCCEAEFAVWDSMGFPRPENVGLE